MPMSKLQKILVVGGGIGGMSLVLGLAKRGLSTHLVEIDPDWKAIGAGLTLNGATLRAFDRLDLLSEIVAHGDVHGGRKILTMKGEVITEQPVFKPTRGDLTAGGGILRPVLHKILASRVRDSGADVSLGVTISHLEQDEDGVRVAFSDGAEGVYSLVVGADGLMSRVRQLTMPSAPAPEFTGQGCWRAVFPRPKEFESLWLYLDSGHKIGFNPVSRDEMYMFMLESAPGNPWRDPSEWQDELAGRLIPWGGRLEALGRSLSPINRINYRPLEYLLLPPPWHVGRIVLLGDACHATTPHAGYGAGLAIEDAIVLSECLVEDRPLDDQLWSYVDRRYERCKSIIQTSLHLGRLEMDQRPVSEQTAISRALAELVAQPVQ